MVLDAPAGTAYSPDAEQFAQTQQSENYFESPDSHVATDPSATLFDAVYNETALSNTENIPPSWEQHPSLSASIVGSDHASGLTNVVGQIGAGIGKELTSNFDGVLSNAAFGAALGTAGRIAHAFAPKPVMVGAIFLGATAALDFAFNAPGWCQDVAISSNPEGKNLADVMAAESRLREFGASSLNLAASGASGAGGWYLGRIGIAPTKVALTEASSFLNKTTATFDEAITGRKGKMSELLALKAEKTSPRHASALDASVRDLVGKGATITDTPPATSGRTEIKQFQKDADEALLLKLGPNFLQIGDNSKFSKWFAWRPKGNAVDDGTRFGLNSSGLVERIVTDKNTVHVRNSVGGRAIDVRYVDADNHLNRAAATRTQPGTWEGNVFGVDKPKWYGEFSPTLNKWFPSVGEMRISPFAKAHQV